jgi:ATPase complex subunit ATP10
MDSNRGKFYLANERLYRKDVSLYFPNLVGRNLARSLKDTTSVLKGKISVVTIFSRKWAEDQAQTFVSEKENPELLQAIQESGGAAQLIEINHEEFRMSSAMLWLFEWNMKRNRSTEQQDRYFIMRGLPQTVKDSIGIMNDKIGYVFLLDRNCKIRWSACADALDSEKDSLVKGIQKLLVEGRG